MSAPKDRVTIHVDPHEHGWQVQAAFWRGSKVHERGHATYFASPWKAREAAERKVQHRLAAGRVCVLVLSPEALEATR